MQVIGSTSVSPVEQHYENHLAAVYSWMAGDFTEKSTEQYELFRENNIYPNSTGIAIDLGAGHGIHTAAVAKLGFTVIAIDFNSHLLKELKTNTLGWGVHTIQTDIRNVPDIPVNPELVVCCGDTLPHLPDEESVKKLIEDIAGKLIPGGRFVLSFRDYSKELKGDRFIPVKSDNTKILTCILDYEKERVLVTDLLHIKTGDSWMQQVSSYYKLRLDTEPVQQFLSGSGIRVDNVFNSKGMVYIFATKP